MRGLRPVVIQEILGLVTRAVKTAVWICKKQGEERFGGYFCLTDQNGSVLLLCPVLEVRKHERYHTFAEEGAVRLAIQNPFHVSGWQSRDRLQEKHGGAIRGNEYVYSFSGFPELIGEAMMITVAKELGDLNNKRIEEILKASKNTVYTDFAKEFSNPVYAMI